MTIQLPRLAGDTAEQERVELFEIDTLNPETDQIEPRKFFIPAKPRAHVGVRYLFLLKTEGENAAVAELLYLLLGKEGFEALSTYEDLTNEQMKQVIDAAKKVTFGNNEGAAGKA